MNIGIHSWTLETRHDLATAMARAAELGYDGYEIDIGNFGNSGLGLQILPDRLQPDERAALRDARDAAGIPICSLCLGALWHYPISSSEDRLRTRGIELVIASIELAADLGASCVLLPIDQPQGMSATEAWAHTQASLETCIPAAEAAGVTLGIENVCSEFLWSARDLARLVDSLSSPRCKVYYDVGNAAWIGLDPAEEIRFLGDRITRIHAKDRSHPRSYPDSQTISVGEPGIVKFPEVVEAIHHIGYDGYIVVEVPTWNMDADRLAQQNLAALRTLLS
jgi:L-ribulose-5-phosphate 3-epimerase